MRFPPPRLSPYFPHPSSLSEYTDLQTFWLTVDWSFKRPFTQRPANDKSSDHFHQNPPSSFGNGFPIENECNFFISIFQNKRREIVSYGCCTSRTKRKKIYTGFWNVRKNGCVTHSHVRWNAEENFADNVSVWIWLTGRLPIFLAYRFFGGVICYYRGNGILN